MLDAWLVGATVGEHVLVRRLGAGGMGTVDLARHVATGATRAIKSLPLSADPDLLLRFQREGEALARLDHPGIVRVHAMGSALGRCFLVMDHLAGGDLEERLRREGPLPPVEVAALGVALARALETAHAAGVLHRDLKPANVLFDEAGRPVLVDFGLARIASAEALSRSGELLGTPAYMAPEQVMGDRAALGPATDVHGLGALLHGALTGRAPFDGRTTLEVLTRVLAGPPTPVERLVPGVPPGLAAALGRALATRPADRFPTAAAFADALEREGPGPRRPSAALGLVALLVLVVAALVASGAFSAPPRAAPSAVPPPVVVVPAPVPRPLAPPPAPAHPATTALLPASVAALVALGSPGEPTFELRETERSQFMIGGPGSALFAERLILNVSSPTRGEKVEGKAAEVRLAFAGRALATLTTQPTSPQTGLAWALLGELFEAGLGVTRSEAEAARCLAAAAAAGHPASIVRLSRARLEGKLGLSASDLPAERDAMRRVLALDPAPEPMILDAAHLVLGLVADRDPGVLSLEDGVQELTRISRPLVTGRVLRIRLLFRLGRPLDADVLDLFGEEPDFKRDAVDWLAELLKSSTPELEQAWSDLVLRRARDGDLAFGLILAALWSREPTRSERQVELARLVEPIAEREGAGGFLREARVVLYRLRRAGAPGSLDRARELVLREPDGQRLLVQIH